MKLKHLASAFFIAILFGSCNMSSQQENTNEIFYADPTIYSENGRFYMSGTRNNKPYGFCLLESTDLESWKPINDINSGMVLNGTDSSSFGDKGFWAPQFLCRNNKYYLTYTANEQVVVAEADSLTGKYTQTSIRPIDASQKNIDSYLFQDTDGKYFLYHVRFNNGNYLWVAEYDWDKQSIKPETLVQCFSQTEDWENTPNYPSSPIMEGPTVLKMKDKYYLFYSANHFLNIDYAMGYATSDSPTGPWVKYSGNPIIHRSIVGENGSGHGDVFFDKNQNPYYVYHVHFDSIKVSPRRTRIVPMIFNYNDKTGIYDISVDNSKIIIPTTDVPLEDISSATDY